eukprot:3355619-Rhodomonas_salina.1
MTSPSPTRVAGVRLDPNWHSNDSLGIGPDISTRTCVPPSAEPMLGIIIPTRIPLTTSNRISFLFPCGSSPTTQVNCDADTNRAATVFDDPTLHARFSDELNPRPCTVTSAAALVPRVGKTDVTSGASTYVNVKPERLRSIVLRPTSTATEPAPSDSDREGAIQVIRLL